ncbi:MAG TPA: small basic protein [Candidatus Omnitrophica bacterium]|nr:MAG: small basic protein [Candidatus Omnitrophota bacterium]RKY43594.1 MAG: small basic protein [Candidatus Omnitrophota bacterium]HEC69376.1 small basic protein [Candidatus Omnitrophota bacterium]
MSLHPSLKDSGKISSKKTVLKRDEKIKWFIEKKEWKEDSPVLGLPKIKIVRLKVSKKEKKEEKKEELPQQESPKETGTSK